MTAFLFHSGVLLLVVGAFVCLVTLAVIGFRTDRDEWDALARRDARTQRRRTLP